MNIYLSTVLVRNLYQIFLVAVIGLFCTVCSGQTVSGRKLMMFGQSSGAAADTVYLDIDQDIAVQLIPFDELVKIAATNSPFVKYQNEVANSLSSGYALSKAQVLQNAAGFANYSGGNQSIISSGSSLPTGTGSDAIGQIANGYRVGVEVRMSLYDLFGRKHQIRQAQSNYQAALAQKQTVELQLRRELITIYQDMITAQQLLKIRLTDEQASLVALRIAEVEAQKGKITADQLAESTSRYVQTKSASEEIKGNFLKNVHQFEAMVGMPIQRMKRN
ncbi:TolC family protein [Spirosoma soli]|uniref:TolC family protein n=1 Tax=Spirosoma soli TaxID=1770529 RepID=A0ABW5M2R1_9BACT